MGARFGEEVRLFNEGGKRGSGGLLGQCCDKVKRMFFTQHQHLHVTVLTKGVMWFSGRLIISYHV